MFLPALALATAVSGAVLPPEESRPDRTGIYLAGSLSLGYGFGHFRYTDMGAAAFYLPGYRPQQVALGSGFSGPSVGLTAALGYAVIPGLAIAVEGRATLYPGLRKEIALRWTGLGQIAFGTIGPLVDWYPRPRGPLHVQLGAGFGSASFWGGQGAIGSFDNIVNFDELQSAHAFLGHGGIGYVWRTRGGFDYGPMLSFSGLHLSSEHSEMNSVALDVAMTAVSF
jgi:hypothetical protein